PNPNPACPRPQRPHFCNLTDQCMPMRQVRQAALDFTAQMYYPYDRVAVISFDRRAHLHLDLVNGDNLTAVQNAIRGIRVYDQSLSRDTAVCAGMFCSGENCQPVMQKIPGTGVDPRPCPSSNVAGALRLAYNILATQGRRDEEGALWAVVMLSDASPNATDPIEGFPEGLCPRYNSNPPPGSSDPTWYWGDPSYRPFCQDGDFEERHLSNSSRYDAEDAALDMLDVLKEAKVVIFSIGYGNLMHNLNVLPGGGRDRNLGEKFMRYAADYTDGDNQKACLQSGNDWFDPWAVWKPQGESCSNYFYAPDADALQMIFREIARRIFTRISR
ncbi:MAG: VWA domain-containing protein, partial [Anaerolineae bacterium]|nr:VWA domain-containing protein [Anaerolineae bacterium]